jgi:hypothetical protein
MTARVADLSVDELKLMIHEVVAQTLFEFARDPDRGLELRSDFVDDLQHSLHVVRIEGELLSAEHVAEELGLHW